VQTAAHCRVGHAQFFTHTIDLAFVMDESHHERQLLGRQLLKGGCMLEVTLNGCVARPAIQFGDFEIALADWAV
jgi:hypothetical protein